jgi:hypothetical protein
MSHGMTIEQLRMHHQHNAVLQKVANSINGLTETLKDLGGVKEEANDKAYVILTEHTNEGDVTVECPGVYKARESAEIALRNAFVYFEGSGGFGAGEQLRILEENPWRIVCDNGMGGYQRMEFSILEREVNA